MMDLDERFRYLRVVLEPVLPPPSIVVVTSAANGDGKSYVACGLARAFAEAGYASVLVDLNDGNPDVAAQLGIPDLPALHAPEEYATAAVEAGSPSLFAMSLADRGLARSLSVRAVTASLAALRNAFDVTIVDAGCLGASNAALQFARASDGVVLAARQGRAIRPADREISATIERVGARLLGVVMTEGPAVHSGPLSVREAISGRSPVALTAS